MSLCMSHQVFPLKDSSKAFFTKLTNTIRINNQLESFSPRFKSFIIIAVNEMNCLSALLQSGNVFVFLHW